MVKGESDKKMDTLPATFFNVSHVSQMLNVHPNTIRRWSEQGILRTYRIGPARHRRFKREDIDAFLRKSATGKRVKASISSHK